MSDIVKKEQASLEVVTKEKVTDYVKTFLTDQLQDNEIMQFVEIATAYNLNPFKREIYCITYNGKDGRKLSILTGYEVYLKRAERTGLLDGWKCWTEGESKDSSLKACIEISRKDRKSPVYHEVYFSEYTQNNSIWNSKPITMIKKVAMAQGFRLAFPDDLGGIPYTSDELPDEMTKLRDITLKAKEPTGKQETYINSKENLDMIYEEFSRVVDKIEKDLDPKDGSNIQLTCNAYRDNKITGERLKNITHYLATKYAETLKGA